MDALVNPFIRGMIILWSGAIADIPSGWLLCNGGGGTPNLENLFIVGAGDTYVVGATGGSVNHTHVFLGTGHSHSLAVGSGVQAGTDLASSTTSVSAAGETDSEEGLPPYYALAYIMKK